MAAHVPATAQVGYPAGKPYKGAANKALYAAHVLAYASKLAGYAANGVHTGQAALFYGMPASKQAATAGLALYTQQYGYRQHMRSSGARAQGANWGGHNAQAHAATVAANKLAQAGAQGGQAAKGQAAAAPPAKVASK